MADVEDFYIDDYYYNFENICRLCLSDQGPMLALRETCSFVENNSLRLIDKINYTTCINITENDDLPYQICWKCDDLVNNYYAFKKTSSVVDCKLHHLAEKKKELMFVEIKSEKVVTCSSDIMSTQPQMPIVTIANSLSNSQPLVDPRHSVDPLLETQCADVHQIAMVNISTTQDNFDETEDVNSEQLQDPLELSNDLGEKVNHEDFYKYKNVDVSKKSSLDDDLAKKMQTFSVVNPQDLLRMGINLNTPSRKEDVTLNEYFPCQSMSLNKNEIIKADSRSKHIRSYTSKLLVSNKCKNEDKNANGCVTDKPTILASLLRQKKLRKVNIHTTELCKRYYKSNHNGKARYIVSNISKYAGFTSVYEKSTFVGDTTKFGKIKESHRPLGQVNRECVECGECFSTYALLVTHIQTHNAVVKRVSCTLCDKTFTCRVLLNSHMHVHHGSKKNKVSLCDICGVLIRYKSFNYHMSTHVSHKNYLCDTCGASYNIKSKLMYHITSKHLDKEKSEHKCNECGNTMTTSKSLKRHMRLHTTLPNIKCPICPKLFSKKPAVDRHMRTHTGETPYVCEICQRGFTIKWNYTQHMRLHTKDKPYVCDVCGKAFTHNVSKRLHMKCHVDQVESKRETSPSKTFQRFKMIKRINKDVVPSENEMSPD